jgi:tight adherence protein C
VILVGVCAVVATLGLGLVARAVFPARPFLAGELEELLGRGPVRPAPSQSALGDVLDGLGAALWGQLDPDGDRFPALLSDLAVMDRSPAAFARQMVSTSVLLGLLGGVVIVGLSAVGLHVPGGVAVWVVLLGAGGGLLAPRAALRGEADQRRAEMGQAVAVICDLAAVVVAAGEDVEAGLVEAAAAGDGWAFERLRRALAPGSLNRQGPWLALQGLGQRLGVDQLVVLAQNMGLAEERGAKVREALNTQAKTLREEEASEVQAKRDRSPSG